MATISIAFDHLRRDLSYAWRGLRRSPTFSVVVAVTLAIGIGANAAVLGIIDTAFLRKLPVPEPERVIGVLSGDTRDGARRPRPGLSSFADYRDLRAPTHGAVELAAYAMHYLQLGDEFAGSAVWSALVSADYFQVLRVHAQKGRVFGPDEEEPRGAHPVAVISDVLWRTRFGSEERAVGRQLTIGNTRFTIIGVAPKGFTGTHGEGRTDLWIPYTMQAEATGTEYIHDYRDARVAFIIGRLAPSATVAEVQGRLDRAARELSTSYPETDRTLRLVAERRDRFVTFEQAPGALYGFLLVLATVALVHLVACSNVASLVLARASARRSEMGIRICLGASRGRLLMQSLAECGLLALLGAVGGLVIARWLTQLICTMQFMSAMDAGLDARVVLIVALVTTATALQFGLGPALGATRNDPLSVIRGTPGMRIAGKREHSAALLVVGQLAMSLMLAANAAVLAKAFERQSRADPGYDASHLMVASVSLRDPRATANDRPAAFEDLTSRATTLPGVLRVAAAGGAPLRGGSYDDVAVAGHEYGAGESKKLHLLTVGPGYFATIGAQLIRGREFTPADRIPVGSRYFRGFDVAVVNEAMARRYWPGVDPIGKQLAFHDKGTATVVGLVRDMHDVTASAVLPRVYFPLFEAPGPNFEVIVRTSGDPAASAALVRSAVASSPMVEPPTVRTMIELRDDATQLSRIGSLALAICAAIALLLTAIGLYGLVAMWAAERRGEIGIRLALGAPWWDIHRLLLGGAGRLFAVGGIVGLAGAVALVRLEGGWFGSSFALELPPVAIALAVLVTVAGVAAFLPARRAASLDPAAVLRAG